MKKLNYIDIFENNFTYFIADTVFADYTKTQRHTHNFCEFFIVKQGELIHYNNDHISILKEGEICFILQDDNHCFQNNLKEGETIITNIAFSPTELQLALVYLQFTSFESVPSESRKLLLDQVELATILKYVDEIYKLTVTSSRLELQSIFRLLLVEVLVIFIGKTQRSETTTPFWLTTACTHMEIPENFRIGIPRFVELTGRTQEHLTRSIKKCFGISPSEFINNIRLLEASRLLRNTSNPVGNILADTGFENASYFNRLFKEKFGLSPLNYRFSKYRIVNPIEN